MGKTVLFYLLGKDFKTGFRVKAQILDDSGRLIADFDGKLPPCVKVQKNLELFQSCYLARAVPMRSPTRIDGSTIADSSVGAIKKADKDLGSSVNQWLKHHGMSRVREGILSSLRDESEEIRFLFKTQNPDLQCLPWHKWSFLRKYYFEAETGLALGVRKEPVATPRDIKVKVLVVFGSRKGFGDTVIDIEPDWKALKRNLEENSNGELIRLDEPTLEQLCDRLATERHQILVFAGHSSSKDDKASGSIQLNEHETVNIDNLEPHLRNAVRNGLQLVIVNSCDGVGIGRQLASFGVPNIIAMASPVSDKVAQKFLQHFLKEFAGGKPLFLAKRKAREELNSLQSEYPGAWNLPVLWEEPTRKSLTWRSLGGIETSREPRAKTVKQASVVGKIARVAGLTTALIVIISVSAVVIITGLKPQDTNAEKPKKVQQKSTLVKPSNVSVTFSCILLDGIPTVIVKTRRGDLPIISLSSNSLEFPERTCLEVSARFQTLKDRGELEYLATGTLKGQSVICATKNLDEACTKSGFLFNVPDGKDPEAMLRYLQEVRNSYSNGPLSL